MKKLNEDQQNQIVEIVKREDLFKTINDILTRNNINDLEAVSIKFTKKEIINDLNLDPAENFDRNDWRIPICKHGKPMVEVCRPGGWCGWECNH